MTPFDELGKIMYIHFSSRFMLVTDVVVVLIYFKFDSIRINEVVYENSFSLFLVIFKCCYLVFIPWFECIFHTIARIQIRVRQKISSQLPKHGLAEAYVLVCLEKSNKLSYILAL